jgi:cell wall-associated NlpC family hydrolase
MIRPNDLIGLFQKAYTERWGYILNTAGETWTDAKQLDAENQYRKAVEAGDDKAAGRWKTAALYGKKWINRRVSDCSGLFSWAFKQLNGYMYHGSNTMYSKYTTAKGKLINGRREDGNALKPATALFKYNDEEGYHHVGLYIGDGKVIEAQGTQSGGVSSDVKKWHFWGELKGVDYNEEAKPMEYEEAMVVADGGVNLRAGKSTNTTKLATIPKGTMIEAADAGSGWSHVKYGDKTGYCMSRYIEYGKGFSDNEAVNIINNIIKELGQLKEMLEP